MNEDRAAELEEIRRRAELGRSQSTAIRERTAAPQCWAELLRYLSSKKFPEGVECVVYFPSADICIQCGTSRVLRLTAQFERQAVKLSWENPGGGETTSEGSMPITVRDDGKLEFYWKKCAYTDATELSEALISFAMKSGGASHV